MAAQRGGWSLLCHPAFRDPLLSLAEEVAHMRERGGAGWADAPKAKLLHRIVNIVLKEVPSAQNAPIYELGNTLGADARGWRRVKFLGRPRLFFRFDSGSRIIVYAWVNDENTLRKAGASSDPYTVFRAMLIDGNPPHDWGKLLETCRISPGDPKQTALAGIPGDLVALSDYEPVGEAAAPKKGKRKR